MSFLLFKITYFKKQKQKFTDLCQEVEDDEEGVVNIHVTEEMSKNDVVDQIVEKTQNYLQK